VAPGRERAPAGVPAGAAAGAPGHLPGPAAGAGGRPEREQLPRWPSLITAPHSSQTRHAQQAGSPPACSSPVPSQAPAGPVRSRIG